MKKAIVDFVVGFISDISSSRIFKVLAVLLFFSLFSVIGFSGCILYWNYHNSYDFSKIGPIGDFLGGSTAPIIGLISVVLTFAAFYIQFKANQIQKSDLERQRSDWERERFEGRFFEMLKLHKENLSDINYTGYSGTETGKSCFPQFLKEYEFIVRQVVEQRDKLPVGGKARVRTERLAYSVFFFGIGEADRKMYLLDFNDVELDVFRHILPFLVQEQRKYNEQVAAVRMEMNGYSPSYEFKPFLGHASHLGTYYRHLFHIVEVILKFKKFTSESERYYYMRLVRSQLSVEEQMLLYYNGSAWFPFQWKPAFTEYRLIKNVFLGKVIVGINPPNEIYEREMIKLWLTKSEKMFEGQGNIDPLIDTWIEANRREYNSLVLDKAHGDQYPPQDRSGIA